DNSHVQVTLWVPAQRSVFALTLEHIRGDINVGFRQEVEVVELFILGSSGSFRGGLLFCSLIDGSRNNGIELRQTQTMFSRKRDRLTKAELERFHQTMFGGFGLGLIANEVDMLASLTQN